MGIKFTINPVLYFVLLFLEVYGMYYLISSLTSFKAKKEKVLKVALLFAIVMFLLDVFVFKYHKSGVRALVFLAVFFIFVKSVGNLSLLKSSICTLIFLAVAMAIDIVTQIIMKLALSDVGMAWMYDNFAYTYVLYLFCLYAVGWIVSLRGITLIKLEKINM